RCWNNFPRPSAQRKIRSWLIFMTRFEDHSIPATESRGSPETLIFMESPAGESLKSVTLACRLLFKPIIEIEIIMAVFYSAERNVTSVGIGFRFSRRWYMPLVTGVILTLLSQIQAGAAVINAASPSFGNVSTAIALAANGDTIVIPAGTATWT